MSCRPVPSGVGPTAVLAPQVSCTASYPHLSNEHVLSAGFDINTPDNQPYLSSCCCFRRGEFWAPLSLPQA